METKPSPIVDAIYAAYERSADRRRSRRLGASAIGKECDRAVWLAFRHAAQERFDGRMLRLFATGHREEARMIEDLRAAGMDVWDRDESGEQFTFTSANGHLVCKVDGVVRGVPGDQHTPHLLEIKTANRGNFDRVARTGVRNAKPEHYVQITIGMGLADLSRALYVVACKDDDRIYAESVRFDESLFRGYVARAERIIRSENAPDRVSADPAFWLCKFCSYSGVCRGDRVADANCRTCVHAAVAREGSWSCANGLDMDDGCRQHVYIPDLLAFADPQDGDPTWVRYRIRSSGREFVNCASAGYPATNLPHYSSNELSRTAVAAIGDPAIEAAREILGGEVIATNGPCGPCSWCADDGSPCACNDGRGAA